MNPKVVARNIENLRQSKNWTQEDIAEKLIENHEGQSPF